MATKKVTKPRNPPPDELPEFTDEIGTGPSVDASGIENLLNQLGELHGDAKVHVYRVRQGIRPPFAFLFATTAGQFDVEDVAARYGGGDFFVRAWQRGIPGTLVNERFAIEGEPRHPYTPPTAQPIPNVPGAPTFYQLPQQGGDAIAALGAMFERSMAQLATVLAERRPERTLEETLALFATFKQISGGAGDQLGMLKEIMGIMREAQPLTGEDGKADAWSVLQTAAERILPVLVAGAQARPQLPAPGIPSDRDTPPRVAPGSPPGARPAPTTIAEAARMASAPHAPVAPQAPNFGASPMRPINGGIPPQVSAFAGTLVNAARIGAQPDDYAQFIVDQIDGAPQIEPAVREYLNSPTWFAQIVALYPEAQAHEPWFTTLRRAVIDALDAAPDAAGEGDDLTGAGGEDISGLEEGPYAPGGGRH